jgi:nitroreductase
MNELYELTRKRRSVRRYGTAHIDDEVIHEIMKVALTAPTSFGHKPVEYVVVDTVNYTSIQNHKNRLKVS